MSKMLAYDRRRGFLLVLFCFSYGSVLFLICWVLLGAFLIADSIIQTLFPDFGMRVPARFVEVFAFTLFFTYLLSQLLLDVFYFIKYRKKDSLWEG